MICGNGTVSGTVTLLKDVKEKVNNWRTDKTITVSLGTYRVEWSEDNTYVIYNYGKLTLRGTSSTSQANIGSTQYSNTNGIYNGSNGTLICWYLSFNSYKTSLSNNGTAYIYYSDMSPVSSNAIYSSGGTIDLSGSTLSVQGSSSPTVRIINTTLNFKSGTITSALAGKAIYASGTSVLNVSGGTISSDTRTSCNDSLVGVYGDSAKMNMTGGTINNTKHNMAVAVDGQSSFTMSGGTINASSYHALKTESKANPSINITGGKISHTTASTTSGSVTTFWCAILVEMKDTSTSSRNYINITGGTITSKNASVIGISDKGTGRAAITIGNSSTTYTNSTPELISYESYIVDASNTPNKPSVYFYNGSMTSKQSSYNNNCNAYVRSGYSRKSNYGSPHGAYYYHTLTKN